MMRAQESWRLHHITAEDSSKVVIAAVCFSVLARDKSETRKVVSGTLRSVGYELHSFKNDSNRAIIHYEALQLLQFSSGAASNKYKMPH